MHDAGFLPVSDTPIFSNSFWQTSDADGHIFPTKIIKFLLRSDQQVAHSYGEGPLQTKRSLCDIGAFIPPNISRHLYFSILSPLFKYTFNNKSAPLLSLTQHHNTTESCPYLISSLLNHTHTQMQIYNMSPHSCVHSTCCIILSLMFVKDIHHNIPLLKGAQFIITHWLFIGWSEVR